jgi:hypothetical protein
MAAKTGSLGDRLHRERDLSTAFTFAQRKPGLTARFSSPAWGRRRHLPEGNSCLHYGCHLGGWGNRIASQQHDYASGMLVAQRKASHASHAKSGNIFRAVYAGNRRTANCFARCE